MTDAAKAAALERVVVELLGTFDECHAVAMMVERLRRTHGAGWVEALVLEYRRRDDE